MEGRNWSMYRLTINGIFLVEGVLSGSGMVL